jgi:hypothetical protein
MISGPRLIQTRWILLAIIAFCIYEAWATWHEIERPAPAHYDLTVIFMEVLLSLICANFLIRTPFIGDRIVIGPIMVASVLWVVIRLAVPSQQTVHVVRIVVSLMWFASLIGGVVVLIRYPKGWEVPHRITR